MKGQRRQPRGRKHDQDLAPTPAAELEAQEEGAVVPGRGPKAPQELQRRDAAGPALVQATATATQGRGPSCLEAASVDRLEEGLA